MANQILTKSELTTTIDDNQLPPTPPSVSPRIQGLALFIDQAVIQLRQERDQSLQNTTNDHDASHDCLLFLGNWHDAHPRRLFHDDVLKPVDKVVWAVIRHHALIGDATAFPSYQTIGRCANIGSKATVARAIIILRLTRWVSLCARVRDAKGRFQGNIYALHDEPISVEEALFLDPDYLSLLQTMTRHHHSRVRQVANSVLAKQEETSTEQTGKYSSTATTVYSVADFNTVASTDDRATTTRENSPTDSMEQMIPTTCESNIVTLEAEPIGKSDTPSDSSPDQPQNLNPASRVQKINEVQKTGVQELNLGSESQNQKLNLELKTQVQKLNPSTENKPKQIDNLQAQKLNPVAKSQVQKLNPVVQSCCCINQKTTTLLTTSAEKSTQGTIENPPPPAFSPGRVSVSTAAEDVLHLPPQLTANDQVLAQLYLEPIPQPQRQNVLDELQGRIQQAAQNGKPIRNPVGYLVQLCHAAQQHHFQFTDVGLQVQKTRQSQQEMKERSSTKPKPMTVQQPKPPSLPKSANANPLVKRLLEIQRYVQTRTATT